ncbi:MAG TPA: helix-turn-helix domain-containing protein [Gaiellaceae bacterium]|nr:helix-turn-helix domain-containing protein [Gaiellaceae bacterium]
MSRDERATRTAALEAARDLFGAEGYHGVGLERVAKRAGVSRQTIYLHFGSKAGLLVELARYEHERSGIDALAERTVWSAPDAVAALEAWVALFPAFAPQVLDFVRALDGARRSDPDAAEVWRDQSDDRWQGCRRLAEWLKRDGVLAPGWTIRSAADLIWALASLQMYDWLTLERGWSAGEFTRRIQQTLRRTLVAR